MKTTLTLIVVLAASGCASSALPPIADQTVASTTFPTAAATDKWPVVHLHGSIVLVDHQKEAVVKVYHLTRSQHDRCDKHATALNVNPGPAYRFECVIYLPGDEAR